MPCLGCTVGETAYTRDLYRDFTTHLGGPILRDRLWFFAGYQYQRDYDSQPGTDPAFPRKFEADRFFWKLTWQVTPRLKFLHSFAEELWANPERPSLSRPFETTARFHGHRPTATFVNLTHVLSENTFWEARLSGFRSPEKRTPNNGSTTTPYRLDLGTGIASGGTTNFGTLKLIRNSAQGKLSHYASDFLSGDHDLKFGVQFQHGAHEFSYAYPGGAHYYDIAGQPDFARFRAPRAGGGEFKTLGVFAEDSVRLGGRLTLNLGARFDHTRGISQDVPAMDPLGTDSGDTIAGLGTLYTWSEISPRLGFNFKVTPDGRTILRGNYGRFYQGVLTGELGPVHPGISPFTDARFDPATGRYTNVIAVTDPRANLRVDAGTGPPQTDQFSLGVDRTLWPNLAVGVTYVHKEGRDFIGWEDTAGVYGTRTDTLPNGETLTVFPLLSPASQRRFLLTNQEDYFLRFNALLFALEKRWSQHWQALVSYSVSETVGLQASNGADPSGGQSSSTLGGGTFGRDPNTLINAQGSLPDDRTHMFRALGSVEIPRIGVLVGASFQHLTGKPWAATTLVRLPQGTLRVFLEPRGSQRLSSQTLLDLRVSKIFRFGGTRKLEFLADLLNLLNETAEEGVVTDNLFSPNFARANQFVDPRRVMLGVKVDF